VQAGLSITNCLTFVATMKAYLKRRLSKRQYELMRMLSFEYKRWKCRVFAPKRYSTSETKFHLGSGARPLKGWLNVDMVDSDLNLDVAAGRLPFDDSQFDVVLSQHVIEHLTIEDELLPLLKECHRCMRKGGEIWLSTPDMEKVAKSYISHQNTDMIEDRKQRLPHWSLGDYPSQHFMNDMFHQGLEHRNLFDFGLLKWCLEQAGFVDVQRVDEAAILAAYPDVPARNDDYQSVYVKATR
jgi:predicted SAM-dependent methyltransferase